MYLDDNLKKELVTILEKLISFKTINEENDKYPFGLENKKCLDYILQLGKRFNFNTKSLDNYCGYLEIGKGDKTIGIVCHTDIVPEGAGWNSNPYKLTQINNKLYGRGTVDDKGPLAACIIALKIISTMNVNLNKKIRLIVGCNEETGCKCMQYYKTKEKQFDYFCTTLSVSPYKDSTKLNEIGKVLEKKYGVKYLYSDFKKKEGYKRSNELAKIYDLYRQHYCGCEYSITEVCVK